MKYHQAAVTALSIFILGLLCLIVGIAGVMR